MNDRIKKLAEQATTRIDPSAHDGVCWDFDKEKFAELIVGECADVLLQWKNEPFPFDEDVAVSLIKEHFGVEELKKMRS
jgi:hypothetical protein